ncbi:IS110 family transposase [Belnapia sp. T18]|uniref:IS110 family transposase n=1 Tax=Belnapia arida TaxID=2804533 RepID=A0ABS1UDL6_9PROT|nr:IS110 family transposase [Belnapia arida]
MLTDIMGLSGRAIPEALVAGETDPEKLLALVHRRVEAEPAQLSAALSGRVGDSHRFLLRLHLGQYDALAKALEAIDLEVERNLDPFRDAVRLLRTVPGIGDLAARAIVAEIGSDMRRFPTAAHLVSWAGLCPRNDESAGKRRSTRLRKGAPWLKTALIQCAWAASRKKDGYLRAQFQRAGQGSAARRVRATAGPRCSNPPPSAAPGARDRDRVGCRAVACARSAWRPPGASAGVSCGRCRPAGRWR